MPQDVRMDMDWQSQTACVFIQSGLDKTGGHASSAGIEKEGVSMPDVAFGIGRGADGEPVADGIDGGIADRNSAGLVAFAGDGDFFFVQIDPACGDVPGLPDGMDVESCQLGDAQSA